MSKNIIKFMFSRAEGLATSGKVSIVRSSDKCEKSSSRTMKLSGQDNKVKKEMHYETTKN